MSDDAFAARTRETPPDGATSGTGRLHALPQIPDHELIRPIGRGSYGDVWLARSVMGTYRAVKIIYRHTFKEAHPFEREYNGIQKFEPVSRSHEGLMDILQIGRNDQDGYFYYVMELADDEAVGQSVPAAHSNISGETSGDRRDACPTFDATAYVPKTIRTEISRRGRLPFDECLQLGLSLTAALGHLHKGGLVHRDVKPSNIIFCNGIAKLADIGLVADVGEAKSFVGTEGFIAPEGPGTPQADIYSLGKVLYEIATGKDRQCFPEPPTLLGEFADRDQLIELNEVIIKACETDPRRRYQSAEAMLADLALLQSGRSVKRLRVVERRLARARRAGLAAAGVAALATLAVLMFANQARVERESRKQVAWALDRAKAAEQVTRQESYANAMLLAYESVELSDFGLVRDLLRQTRSFATEPATTNAARSVPAWEWRHLLYECRDESSLVLTQRVGHVDCLVVSPDDQWLVAGDDTGQILLWRLPARRDPSAEWHLGKDVENLAFSPDSQRFALGCMDGSVFVLAFPSGKAIAEFRERSRILNLRFSPEGSRLAFCSFVGFSIANVDDKSIWQSPLLREAWRAEISPDLELVAMGLVPEGLAFYRAGTNVVTFPDVIGDRVFSRGLAISPDGLWLAIALADYSIEIRSLKDLQRSRRLAGHVASVLDVAWSDDSRLLASGSSDQTIVLWDVQNGTVVRKLRGHQYEVQSVAFSRNPPNGQVLLDKTNASRPISPLTLYSGSSDNMIKVWTSLDAEPASDAVTLPSEIRERDKTLVPGARFLLVRNNLRQSVYGTRPVAKINDFPQLTGGNYGVSPDGDLLVAVQPGGDLCEIWRHETNRLVLRATHHALKNMIGIPSFSSDGRHVALLAADGAFGVWQVEPWRELARWEGEVALGHGIIFDPPGKRVFVICHDKGAVVGDIDTGRLVQMPKEHKEAIYDVAISPDNRLVATTGWDQSVIVWAFAPGEEPHRLTTIAGQRITCWSVAFSPDGRRLAIGMANGQIYLWDFQHNIKVGVLRGHKQPVWALGFNPDDDSLVSVSPDQLRVWRVAKGDD